MLGAVASAVRSANGTAVALDAILPLAYDDVEAMMLPVARRSLLAHLQKLSRDGRVALEPGPEELYRPAG